MRFLLFFVAAWPPFAIAYWVVGPELDIFYWVAWAFWAFVLVSVTVVARYHRRNPMVKEVA